MNNHALAPLRPAIHLTPQAGWMNDPNGLCKVGETWHAFYQHDPLSLTHGVMHWGHATSTDLLHWDHHEIALAPDELGVIFSGSAVVDLDNTAGFGEGAIVAVFTHDLDGLQRQSLAFSLDGGSTFSKYVGNPVLEAAIADFRDPKVVAIDDEWVMALAAGDRINFYTSVDLKSWTSSGSYTYPLDGGVWECPDLLPFPESDDPAMTHVLTVCGNRAGPHHHSGTWSVPGKFVNGTFEAVSAPQLFDHGPDFYAAQAFSTAEPNDRVIMGWMGSWGYPNPHPATNYRGAMSVPRRAELVNGHVRQHPILDAAQASEPLSLSESVASEPQSALLVVGAGDLSLTLTGQTGLIATVVIDRQSASITRHGDFLDRYAEQYSAPLSRAGDYQVLIDHGTIEVFAASGATVLSALVFGGADWWLDVTGATEVRRLR